jgi:hypothetical protein
VPGKAIIAPQEKHRSMIIPRRFSVKSTGQPVRLIGITSPARPFRSVSPQKTTKNNMR